MADLEKTVRIIFSGKDDMSKTMSTIGRGFDQIDSVVMSAAERMAAVGEATLKTQAALVTLATGGLTVSVLAAKDFDSQFREITTLIDETGEGVDQFRLDILKYSRDSQKSIDDINASIYAAISAGVGYKESLEFVSKAEELAIAGKSGLQEATVLLASVMNAYGAESDEATRYSDAFFKTVKLGQTTLPELAESLSKLTSIAAAADVPIETVTGAVAHLTAQGMPTTEAVTAIRGALQGLIKPSSEAVKYAAELGIEFNAQALASKGLEGVLIDVYEATEGNVDSVAKLFGKVQGLTGVLSAVGSDGGDAFLGVLDEMRNASGSTTIAYEKMSKDINLINQNVANNIRGTLVAIGDQVLGSYGDIAGGVTDIFKAIQEAVTAGTFDDIFDMIRSEAEELAEWLNKVGAALPEALGDVDYSQYISTFGSMIDQIKAVFAAIFPDDLTTKEGLADAIQRIVDMGSTINSVTAGIISAFEPVGKAIKSLIDWFLESGIAGEDTARKLGETMGGAILLTKLKENFGMAGYLVAGLIDGFGDARSEMDQLSLDPLGESLYHIRDAADESGKKVEELSEKLNDAGKSSKDLVKEFEDDTKLIDWSDAANQALESVGGSAGKAGDEIRDAFDEDVTIIGQIIPDEASIAKTKKTIKDEIPPEKLMRIQADLDIANIKAEAETFQMMIEWQAKLDIANVEAAVKTLESMFSSIDSTVASTGNLMGSLVGDLDKFRGLDKLKVWSLIEKEQDARMEALDLQKELIGQQIRLNELKLEALEEGEALININAEGLEPDLEMILWKIIEKVQVRANAAGSEFLLGL